MFNICLFIAIFTKLFVSISGLDATPDWLYSTDPDCSLTPCQLIQSRNFICEEHYVTTDDGYIINVQRIINPILKAAGKKTIKPVVLQHGLFGSSVHFLVNSDGGFAADWTNGTGSVDINYEGRNLGYFLANHGYDVWLPNSRGNKYSKNHTTLNPKKDPSFWRISFDEMIAYDSPSVIDYILKITGYENLAWVGHSQGTLLIFGLLSEKPEYAEKIKPFVAMAPIAHVEHITSPIRLLTEIPGLMDFFYLTGGELTLPQIFLDLMAQQICGQKVVQPACGSLLFLVCGYDADQFNFTRVPVYYSQGLGGTSAWNLLHFGQNIINKGFLKFDFGSLINYQRYGTFTPPAYDLGAITSENMVLMGSAHDVFADPTDVETLRKALKVPFTEYRITDQQFSHLDFIWAKNVVEQVNIPMLGLLKKFQ